MNPEKILKRSLWVTAVCLVVLVVASPVLIRKIHGPDLWKALYSGRYLAFFGKFPHHSTFTFSPVRDVYARDAYNWLGNLFLYGWYSGFGLVGLQVLRVILALVPLIFLSSISRFKRDPVFVLGAIAFTYGIHQKLILRTAIMAVPCVVLLLWIWWLARFRSRTRFLYCLPFLFLVWGNSHGSYIIGFVLLILLVFGDLCDGLLGLEGNSKGWLMHLVLSLLLVFGVVAFVGPQPRYASLQKYGEKILVDASTSTGNYGEMTDSSELNDPGDNQKEMVSQSSGGGMDNHLFRSSLGGGIDELVKESFGLILKGFDLLREQILRDVPRRSYEFRSPLLNPQPLFVWVAISWVVVFFVLVLTRPGSVRFSLMLPALASVLLGFSMIRAVAYVPLVLFPAILILVFEGDGSNHGRSLWLNYLSIGLVALWFGATASFAIRGKTARLLGNPGQVMGAGTIAWYRPEIPQYVLDRYPEDRFFNGYRIGSYLIWQWWPRKKVFQDTKISAYTSQFEALRVNLPFPKLLDRWKLDRALVTTSNRWHERYFKPSDSWKSVNQGDGLIIYERQYPDNNRMK